MLIENVNANLLDMVAMMEKAKCIPTQLNKAHSTIRKLRLQVKELEDRNNQLSLSILDDQSKIDLIKRQLHIESQEVLLLKQKNQGQKTDRCDLLELMEQLRQINGELEIKNDGLLMVIQKLKSTKTATSSVCNAAI